MRRLGTAIVLLTTLACLNCGLSGPPQGNILSGKWEAGLQNPDGTLALGFTATLKQSGSQISVSGLTFVTSSACFGEGTVAAGTFVPSSTTNGVTSGSFQMTVQGPSFEKEINLINLNGNFVRNSISGTWKVSGSGLQCTGLGNASSGNFVMSPMSTM